MRFVHFRRHFDVVQHRSLTIPTTELGHFSAADEPTHVVASSIGVLVPTRTKNHSVDDMYSGSDQTCCFASSACFNSSSLNGASFGILISLLRFSTTNEDV